MVLPFENNTRKIVKKLAKKSLGHDKIRNILIVIIIIIVAALLSAMSFIYNAQVKEVDSKMRGQYQAACIDCSEAEMERLSKSKDLEGYGISKILGTTRYKDCILNVLYEDKNMNSLLDRPEIKGKMPQKQDEILVEKSFLNYCDLSEDLGQKINLDLGSGVKAEYTIVGIYQEKNRSEARNYRIVVSKDYVVKSKICEPIFDFLIKYKKDKSVNDEQLKSKIKHFFDENGIEDKRIVFNSNYFDLKDFSSENTLPIIFVAIFILIACSIVIYSIFYISVSRKVKEYGRLKVIGTTTSQLKSIVRLESLYLSFYAIPIGIIIGGFSAFIWSPNYWSTSENILDGIVIIGFIALTVAVASFTPVKMAGEVSPIEAVKSSSYNVKISKKTTKKLRRKIKPITMAFMNFTRNPQKAIITTISLGITGIILMCISTYINSIDLYSMARKQLGDGGNYLISWQSSVAMKDTHKFQRNNYFDDKLKEKILSLESVTNITSYDGCNVKISFQDEDSRFIVLGLNEDQMKKYLTDSKNEDINYDKLVENNGIIISDSENLLEKYNGYKANVGDILKVESFEGIDTSVNVMGVNKNKINTGVSGYLFVLPDTTLRKLYPSVSNFQMCWNIYAKEDSQKLREEIFNVIKDNRIKITSCQDLIEFYSDSFRKINVALYIILVFIFIFALINLINSLITNLITRKEELGILRSVGMTEKQLSAMLQIECFCYIVSTLIITFTIGTLLGFILCKVFNTIGAFGIVTYHFPIKEVSLFTVLLFIIQFIYGILVSRYMGKQYLVEYIK